jgi:hypothetical protein
MDRADSSNWADAKLAERQAFNQIAEAGSQADWLNAWKNWASTLQQLRQQARMIHLAPAAEVGSPSDFHPEQSI